MGTFATSPLNKNNHSSGDVNDRDGDEDNHNPILLPRGSNREYEVIIAST